MRRLDQDDEIQAFPPHIIDVDDIRLFISPPPGVLFSQLLCRPTIPLMGNWAAPNVNFTFLPTYRAKFEKASSTTAIMVPMGQLF
jgi:hypothetical protein